MELVPGMGKWAVFRDQGRIEHAEMKFGDVIIHVDSAHTEGPFAAGPTTEGPYVSLEGVDALYERACSRGSEVVLEIHDRDFGSRTFALRDPEGRVWSFGTYVHEPEQHIE